MYKDYYGKIMLTDEERMEALRRAGYYFGGSFNRDYYYGLVNHELDDDDRLLLDMEMKRNCSYEDEYDKKTKEFDSILNENPKTEGIDEARWADHIQRDLGEINFYKGSQPVVPMDNRIYMVTPNVLQFDKPDKNGRVYPKEVVDEALENFNNGESNGGEIMHKDVEDTKYYTVDKMREIRNESKKKVGGLFSKIGDGIKKIFTTMFCEEVPDNETNSDTDS